MKGIGVIYHELTLSVQKC